jgi:hypothetical protein
MRGDIALAGFMLTAEEWHALDPVARAQLLAAADTTRRDDAWVVAPITGALSQPHGAPPPDDR